RGRFAGRRRLGGDPGEQTPPRGGSGRRFIDYILRRGGGLLDRGGLDVRHRHRRRLRRGGRLRLREGRLGHGLDRQVGRLRDAGRSLGVVRPGAQGRERSERRRCRLVGSVQPGCEELVRLLLDEENGPPGIAVLGQASVQRGQDLGGRGGDL